MEQNPHSAATKVSEVEQTQLQQSKTGPALALTISNALCKFLMALWIYGFAETTHKTDTQTDPLPFLFHHWKQQQEYMKIFHKNRILNNAFKI